MKSAVNLCGALALVLASSCGSDHAGSHSIPKSDQGGYARASCLYSFDEGGTAQSSPGASETRTMIFGKRIDFAHVRAVSRASAASTVDYVKLQGADVFGTPDSGHGCLTFQSLPVPPADLLREWTRAADQTEDSTSVVMGLYIPRGTGRLASSASRALIAIRHDANRWTLVHEFAHHLFDLADRDQGEVHDERVKSDFATAMREYKSIASDYEADRGQANFTRAAEKLIEAVNKLRPLLLRYALEEMAIETMLMDEYVRGNLAYFPIRKKSSYLYVASSAESALGFIDDFRSMLRKLRSEGRSRGYTSDETRLNRSDDELSVLASEIARRGAQALRDADRSTFVDMSDGMDDATFECSQARETRELAAIVRRALR
ncbi:MAG TPA: hypothetical protein VM598_00515 [Bdellovibrionota bacterium]|nr:hypothetical protein [Bdellovibrionota bacterium]